MARLRSLISLAVLLVVFLFFLFLGYENSEPASLGLLNWRTPSLPVFYWVAAGLAVGAVSGFALAGGFGFRRGVQTRRLRQELEATQREVHELRQSAGTD